LRRVGLDLGAQAVDVGVDRVLVAFVAVAPHGIEQVHARKHLAGLAGEEVEQVEFSRREVQAPTVEGHFAGDRIDGQTVEDQAASIHLQVARHGVDPAQQRFDPGHQFQHGKRLGQVIVGPQFQAENPVHFAGAGAGDDDRRVARHGTGAPADFQAVDAGQHQVEDQRIPTALLQQAHAFVAVGAVHHLELLIAQVQADQVGDMQIVLDHEDSFGLFHPAQSFGAMNALCEMLLVVGASKLAPTIEIPRHCAAFPRPELSRIV
jgi:hypothetical protein